MTKQEFINLTQIQFSKVCGVLVELQRLSNICILIENFKNVMPGRMLFFFCSKSDYEYYTLYYKSDLLIKIVNTNAEKFTTTQYNDYWKKSSFWDNFSDYTHVLTINNNGYLCENSKLKIEEFFTYDFVGSYSYDYRNSYKYNGKFSFRNIQAIKDVLKHFPPLPTQHFNSDMFNSDMFNSDMFNSDMFNSDMFNSDMFNSDISFKTFSEDFYFTFGLLLLNYNNNKKENLYYIGLDELNNNFCNYYINL